MDSSLPTERERILQKLVTIALIAILIGGNVALLIQNHTLEEAVRLNIVHELEVDLRGLYTYPRIGTLFIMRRDNDSMYIWSPLTLAIFFSAETSCPSCLSEIASYRRLIPVFRERGQKVVAVTMRKDSIEVAAFLEAEGLDIPLMVSRLGMTFEEMGMYPKFMPFKILFDSTNTAIYMRGANNSPKSQARFESAMLWLSNAIHKK